LLQLHLLGFKILCFISAYFNCTKYLWRIHSSEQEFNSAFGTEPGSYYSMISFPFNFELL
jgi:hypothetical protein